MIGYCCRSHPAGAMAVLAYWNARDQRHAIIEQRREQVRGWIAGRERPEAMLAADDLSAIRRLIADAVAGHELTMCRLVLSDGHIVADADLAEINLNKLEPHWSAAGGVPETAETIQVVDQHVQVCSR